jgi:2-keto-4-pentenoate hydratase/2-oxohepta-3-ene-1,7-dioic acid hydratase in catechol pathway
MRANAATMSASVTGTPAGVGALRKPPLWLKPGDVCTISIEKIGTLTNPVEQEQTN